jgi:hypothetical protein
MALSNLYSEWWKAGQLFGCREHAPITSRGALCDSSSIRDPASGLAVELSVRPADPFSLREFISEGDCRGPRIDRSYCIRRET